MLRRVKRRSIRLVFVVGSLTYLLIMLLVYSSLDQSLGGASAVKWFKPFFDPFEIINNRRCTATPLIVALKTAREMGKGDHTDQTCAFIDNEADIEMDTEWARIGVGYPQMVLSITGWVDTIQVNSWSTRPLHVIVIPFSHQDPGWKNTYDSEYTSFTRSTLSLVVRQLEKNPSWRFVWSETVFLERWWNEATQSQRSEMKSLLHSGRLEILGGGWVMPDEASTHYAAILNQLIEGHLWIAENLGIIVNTSWAIDPFGHSATLAYLNREAGIKNMLIQRTHFAVKRHFAKTKSLEFFWKQRWSDKSVFCHMMPFLLYNIPHSCGPDRHVCCQFDFSRPKCFRGKKKIRHVAVTAENLHRLAKDLWTQLQKKAELYRSDVVLMPHGDDFRYHSEAEWKDQFNNLEKLMEYINDRKEMNMKIEFGTLSDYFNQVHKSKAGPKHQDYPSLIGDFFPYSDRGDQYWSGHYTSRPFFKRMTRILQAKLRSAEIMFTAAQARHLLTTENTTSIYNCLVSARRASSLFQHHDAITGTSKKAVVRDYTKMLYDALTSVQELQSNLIKSSIRNMDPNTTKVTAADVWLDVNDLPLKRLIDIKTVRYLIVHNPLFQTHNKVVSVHVNSIYVTVLKNGQPVKIQLGPVFEGQTNVKEQEYTMSFEVEVPPITSVVYELKPKQTDDLTNLAAVTIYRKPKESSWFRNLGLFKTTMSADKDIYISNDNITAIISNCDGMLKYVYQDEHAFKSDVHYIVYKTGTAYNPLKDKSGAYLFLPDGPANDLASGPISVLKISGQLYEQVRTVYNDSIHYTTIFKLSTPEAASILLENLVDIGNSQWDNRELALRLETDVVASQHRLCTDSNGFQMQERTTRHMFGIQGNFYPLTTSAFLEDDTSRVTVLTSEAHGVASLASGTLDIILDRRLMQDDWRGLNEGVDDNRPVQSSFFLVFERKHQKRSDARPTCHLSPLATALSTFLNNPPETFIVETNTLASPINIPQMTYLPCGHHVVNLRIQKSQGVQPYREALLILHRIVSDCSFHHRLKFCSTDQLSMASLFPFIDVLSVKEMTLTGTLELRDINPSHNINIPPMEIKTYKIVFR